jgi:hypothetical protein
MTDEADDKYISLEDASALLSEQGLTGQTVPVLRAAIAGRRLEAIKDGRAWRTTKRWLDSYLENLRVNTEEQPRFPTMAERRAFARKGKPVTITLPPDWQPPPKKKG